jgi:DNA-binding winged helix-turn-helix (wHTH) protein
VALAFGDFVFDPVRRELRKGGSLLKVDAKQLDLLNCFLSHPGKLLSKQEIIDDVWEGRAVAESALSVTVAKLRKALGDAPSEHGFIENRYGRGYRFLAPVVQVQPPSQVLGTLTTPPSGPTPDNTLVGRADSLHRLEAALLRARSGEGGVCVLIGEAGIGKTRLAETLEQTARRAGVATAWGRFQPAPGAPPLWAFAQVLRELDSTGLADELLQTLHEERATRTRPEPGAPGDANAGWRPALEDAVSASHRTLDRIAQTLAKLSQQRTLLILLDDLQWADAASLRLLTYVASDLQRWPMLIVATQRSPALAPDDNRNPSMLRLLTHRSCERIELQRLGEPEVAEYVRALFGEGADALCRAVFARSEGNPFYMVELLRPWAFGRTHETRPEPEQLALSEFALDPMRQRLSRLPYDARQVLSAAAVIGHDFDLGLLSQVTQRGADELLEALDGSLANETIVLSSEMVGGYAFDHELIREVLYSDLPASERCRLHLRIGEALMRRRAAGQVVVSAELAQHFLAALPQGDVSVAVEHARDAAAAAARLGSYMDTRMLLRRALEALQLTAAAPVETRTALLLELAIVERALGDPSYRVHLQQGVALAREHALATPLTRAGQLLSLAPGLLTDSQASSVLEAALDVLPRDDARHRALVLAHLSWTPPHSRSARKVEELLALAEAEAARSGDPQVQARVRDARFHVLSGPATMQQAEPIARAIEHDIQEHRDLYPRSRKLALFTTRLLWAAQRGDRVEMEQTDSPRQAELSKLNNVELNWHHQRYLVVQRMNRGDFTGVGAEIEQLRRQAKRLELQAGATLWALDFGTLLTWTGGAGEFAARVRPTLALRPDDPPQTLAHKLRSMVDYGFIDEARSALTSISLEEIRDLPADRDYLGVLSHLAAASAATGTRDYCEALYELLRPYPEYFATGMSFHIYGSVSHLLGSLALELERPREALDHFFEAERRNAAFELRGWTLRSQLAIAQCLLDTGKRGDKARADAILSDALAIATGAGMTPLMHTIQRLLRSDVDVAGRPRLR